MNECLWNVKSPNKTKQKKQSSNMELENVMNLTKMQEAKMNLARTVLRRSATDFWTAVSILVGT